MNRTNTRKSGAVYIAPQTWLGRIAAAALAILLVLLAMFFFAVFLAVFSVLAVIMITRVLWLGRRVDHNGEDDVLVGEYSVETGAESREEQESAQQRLPENRRDH